MKPKRKENLDKVRTRYEPPTLDEAIFAAQGITADIEAQVTFAAELTGRPEEEVRQAALRARQPAARTTSVQVVGARRPVIVERMGRRTVTPLRMMRG